jgi:archaellum component FlaF (FlaF/FlaG flagellin family)
MEKITSSTLIPISLVITFGYLIFSLGDSYSQIKDNKEEIIEIKKDEKEILSTLKSIENRLIKIETSLKMMAK